MRHCRQNPCLHRSLRIALQNGFLQKLWKRLVSPNESRRVWFRPAGSLPLPPPRPRKPTFLPKQPEIVPSLFTDWDVGFFNVYSFCLLTVPHSMSLSMRAPCSNMHWGESGNKFFLLALVWRKVEAELHSGTASLSSKGNFCQVKSSSVPGWRRGEIGGGHPLRRSRDAKFA